jgi:hypothetical protein
LVDLFGQGGRKGKGKGRIGKDGAANGRKDGGKQSKHSNYSSAILVLAILIDLWLGFREREKERRRDIFLITDF